MSKLSTTYLGLELANPLIASASPLSRKIDQVKKVVDAGIGAVVVYSLFEEQLRHEANEMEHFLWRGTGSHPEAMDYFPNLGDYNSGTEKYIEQLADLRKAVKVPLIGSLNGYTRGGWTEWSRRIESTGVDALELNVYQMPTENDLSGAQVEEMVVDLVADVCSRVAIPVSVKLSPFYSSLPNLVRRIGMSGAKGVVLFNRFLQPDIDPDNLAVNPAATLSTSDDLRLPLRWTAILSGRVPVEIALSGGIHTGRDLLKALMAGAQVGQSASALLQGGAGQVPKILEELAAWMKEHEYDSVDQLRGSMSQRHVADPRAFERAQYMRALSSLDDKFV
ncbi:MAG: dihydroorotate dehydrogenase-like protein [Fibrobacterota bacterium]